MVKDMNWKQKFILITLGQAVSVIGSSAVQFALIWWLAEKTASPLMMGWSGIAAFLPMTILSPFAGVAADKYSRKWICILSDMSAAVLALAYAAMLYYLDIPVWSVLVILCLRGVGGAFQQPAMQAIIPQLVPAAQLLKVNGWSQLVFSGSVLLGPVIGAVLYAALPLPVILLTDVIGAVFASVTLAFIEIPRLERTQTEKSSFLLQFQEGFQVYLEDRRLLFLIIAQAFCMLFYGPLSSFYPLMTSSYFKLSAFYGSMVEMTYALGMLISALLFGSILKVKHKLRAAYLGLLGLGITSMLCGLVPPVFTGWLFFALICFFMGASGNIHTIPLTAYMQETIVPERMGRAFSLISLISSLAMPLGLLVSSPIAERVGVHTWFFVSGIGMILIVAAVLALNRVINRN